MRVPALPPVGHLICYEYLWLSQATARGDGSKSYPCAVVLARADLGPAPVAYVAGISHAEPHADRRALPLPAKLKRHLGLDTEPSWIYVDELNIFVWPGPDLRPAQRLCRLPAAKGSCVIGPLPTDWFDRVRNEIVESRRVGLLRSISRSE